MPSSTPPKTSRLTFKPDRYDTALLDGRPLAGVFADYVDGREMFEPLVFPVALFDRSEQAVVFERLKSLNGWTPILVCPDDMDLDCTVFSAWVEERDGRVVWSRYAFGLDGRFGRAEAPPVSFDRREYLDFIAEAEELAAVEHLIMDLGSKPPARHEPAAKLERLGPAAALKLLSRLVFNSARARRGWSGRRLAMLKWTCKTLGLAFLIGVIIVSAMHLFIETWSLEGLVGMVIGVLVLGGFIEAADITMARRETWSPSVFMTGEGFEVGWERELLPWKIFAGGAAEADGTDSAALRPGVLTVAANGRVDYKMKFQDEARQEIDPDLTDLQAALCSLIKSKGGQP